MICCHLLMYSRIASEKASSIHKHCWENRDSWVQSVSLLLCLPLHLCHCLFVSLSVCVSLPFCGVTWELRGDHWRVTWGQTQMILQDTWPVLRDVLTQDTHIGSLCILASVVAPSHRKPPTHEDLRLHVPDPNLATVVSSATARSVSPPGVNTKRRMRVGS